MCSPTPDAPHTSPSALVSGDVAAVVRQLQKYLSTYTHLRLRPSLNFVACQRPVSPVSNALHQGLYAPRTRKEHQLRHAGAFICTTTRQSNPLQPQKLQQNVCVVCLQIYAWLANGRIASDYHSATRRPRALLPARWAWRLTWTWTWTRTLLPLPLPLPLPMQVSVVESYT